jgi:hypothetical protein
MSVHDLGQYKAEFESVIASAAAKFTVVPWLCSPGHEATNVRVANFMWCLVIVGIAACSGCGQRHDVVPVQGIIRYRDEPLAGATVIFKTTREDGVNPLIASAITSADGRFSLVSQFGPREVVKGTLVGRHSVIISKFVPPAGISPEEYRRLIELETQAVETRGFATAKEAAPLQVELLPPRYSDATSTILKAEVSLRAANDFTFDLSAD